MSERPEARRVPGARDLRWDDIARDLQFSQLERVRATAEKWRNGLTALTGLSAVTVTIAGPAMASNLPRGWQFVVAGLQLSALIALALGAWKAMQASFGVPKEIRDNGVRLRQWTIKTTAEAVDRLAFARRATLAGLVALSLAAAATVVGTQPDDTLLRVTDTHNRGYCGSAASDSDGELLVLTGADGTVRRIPAASIVTLNLVDGC